MLLSQRRSAITGFAVRLGEVTLTKTNIIQPIFGAFVNAECEKGVMASGIDAEDLSLWIIY